MGSLKAACLGFFVCMICGTVILQTSASERQSGKPEVAQKDSGASLSVSEIEATIRSKTRVPPRLPSFLHSDYAILLYASKEGYTVIHGATPDCEGQHVCSFGSAQGGVSRIKLGKEGPGVPVNLRRGIRGRFFDTECYAYCNEAYVTWREGGFYYAIGIKAGRKEELIREANSAIPEHR